MSILNVEHLSHGFGDRTIFSDVSFRLLKGEHIGLVGANGEGKSTFMNIVTGKLLPDEGTVEWAKNVHAGYLDQHAVLKKGMTIRDVLSSAFAALYDLESRMNDLCEKMGGADEDSLARMMEDFSEIQERLETHDFYNIDSAHSALLTSGLTVMSQNFLADSAPGYYSQNFCLKSPISCCSMSRPIILTRNISNG